jgi:hypothetical protein
VGTKRLQDFWKTELSLAPVGRKNNLRRKGKNVTPLLRVILLFMFEPMENLFKAKMLERIYMSINRLGGSPHPQMAERF